MSNKYEATKQYSKTVHTTCAYCGVGCGIKANVNEAERAVSVEGLTSHPSNFGRLCSKGTALGDTVQLEGRLLNPEVNGKISGWNEALNTVADRFKKTISQHGPDSVAFYLSGQLLTEDYYVANKLMKGFMGSANIDTNSRLCMSSSVMGHKRAFGTDTVPGCYEDFEEAELIVLVGSNTAWCHPVLYQRIKKHKENNTNVKIVVVDPRRTQTCEIANLHLPIAIGSDTHLFNGLLSYLNDQQAIDTHFIEQHCEGFEQALISANEQDANPSKTALHCDVNEQDIKQFFSWFTSTEKVVTLYSQGVNQSSSGTDKVNAIINCHLATGRIGKPGMGPFSMTGQPNAMGGREVGGLANTLAAHLDFKPDNVARLNRFWQTNKVPSEPGKTAVDLFDAIYDGKIKAVWIMATNPVVSMPNADKVKKALEQCEFVVVSDCVANTDTAELAHVKLPATGWSEKDGTVTNSERRISRQRGLFIPAGNARHDWWIISQVARRMGFENQFDYQHPTDIFREHAQLSGFENEIVEVDGKPDLNSGRLRDFDISLLQDISEQAYNALEPFQWPLNKDNPNGKQRFFADGQFYTPSRKAQFIAIQPRKPVNEPSDLYPFRLNTGRIRDQWHTMTRTGLAPQLNQHISEPFIEINPVDAQEANLTHGMLVEIGSQWGQMQGRLSVTDDIKKGELFAPMHWTNQLSSKSRINAAVNPEVDPICFQPESKHTPVNIQPVDYKWYGLFMTRSPIEHIDAEFKVKIKGHQHERYILAGNQTLPDPGKFLKSWVANFTHVHLQTYEDAETGHYRLSAINQNGQLEAIAFFSRRDDLPETTWLAKQCEKNSLDRRSKMALLSGQAPAGEDIGKIVCACYSVGEKTLCQSIKNDKLTTIDQVGAALKAGTNCGSCVPEIKALLATSLAENATA